MISFSDTFLPAASINSTYSQFVSVTGGTAPYNFALTGGSMPPGLQLTGAGLISGTATTLGLYNPTITVTDSSSPPQTSTTTYPFQVLDLITLQDATIDQAQFVQQFETDLSTTQTWSSGLTTQTSQTLIEYVSAIGTFLTSRIARGLEDAFPETAQSDSAIRAIVNMQGLRLNRKLPAQAPATLISSVTQTLPPYTQLSGGGYSWFITSALSMTAGVPYTVSLKEGVVVTNTIQGLGSDLQTWVSQEDAFTVSDQDVLVQLNGTDLTKAFGALWNYPGVGAYADSTLSDGRLNIQFGAQGYGTVPGVNDTVTISYATTQGTTVNGANVTGVAITGSSVSNITGRFTDKAQGGGNEKPTIAYKNFAAGSFGTYSSAVTKAQYAATVANYPGIVDAFTQAQREINPAALEWMNVIRISALTNSPWSQQQIAEFVAYMKSVTMYQPTFLWQDPLAVPNDVDLSVYCFNSVNSLAAVQAQVTKAIQNLFSIRPGILMTNLYDSDLTDTAKGAAPGQISYVIVNNPTSPMIVTAPLSPTLTYTVIPSGGQLQSSVYSYAVSVDVPSPSSYLKGIIDARTNPPWPQALAAGDYWIVSYSGTIAGTAVTTQDQILALSPGNQASNFQIIHAATNTVIDHGVPNNWVNPQVVATDSYVVLDWSTTPIAGALAYHVWGRRPGHLGIIATLDPATLHYVDTGASGDPTPLAIGAASDTLIRYNTLRSLKVSVAYSNRQQNALFPIRDATS